MDYSPLIEWAAKTGRIEDHLEARMNFVREIVKDNEAAVARIVTAKATKRPTLQPPSPWRAKAAAASAEPTPAASEYPDHLLTSGERAAIETRQREAEVAAAADSGEYPVEWLSQREQQRVAQAKQGQRSRDQAAG